MLKMIRLAPLAAVLMLAMAAAVVPLDRAGAACPGGGHSRARGYRRRARDNGAEGTGQGDRSRGQPLRLRGAPERQRHRGQGHAGHSGDHVGRQLVHHRHQGLRTGQNGQACARCRRDILESVVPSGGRGGVEQDEPVPVHRRNRDRGDEQARRPAGKGRHERVDHHVDPACHRERAEPHAGWSCLPGDRRFNRSVRRALRHGVGHRQRADRDRHCRAGVDRQGRGARRRSADHDGDRTGGGGAGRAGLQLARPPEQDRDGLRPRLRCRSARGAACQRRRNPRPRPEPWR